MSIEQSLATVAETNVQLLNAIRDLIATLSNREALPAAEPAKRSRKAKAAAIDVQEIVSAEQVEAQSTAFVNLEDEGEPSADEVNAAAVKAAAAAAKAASESAAAAEKAAAAAAEAEKAAAPKVLDYTADVRPTLLKAAETVGMPKVMEVLASFGVKSGKLLQPEQLPAVLVSIQALLDNDEAAI